ncbi:MAG: hypothetical protein C5B54_11015 [Acidobacteria bacterium]|nr:MAG: hypothetical protein C5B54_11015 [Acidobacteriota bacterium]
MFEYAVVAYGEIGVNTYVNWPGPGEMFVGVNFGFEKVLVNKLFTDFAFPLALNDPQFEPRTLPERLNDRVNILDWGADPTGQTDSSAAIQAAIDYAYENLGGSRWRHGAEVFMPAGTYWLDNPVRVSIPGNDYQYWESTTTYAAGDRVRYGSIIDIMGIPYSNAFTSKVDGNLNNVPDGIGAEAYWEYSFYSLKCTRFTGASMDATVLKGNNVGFLLLDDEANNFGFHSIMNFTIWNQSQSPGSGALLIRNWFRAPLVSSVRFIGDSGFLPINYLTHMTVRDCIFECSTPVGRADSLMRHRIVPPAPPWPGPVISSMAYDTATKTVIATCTGPHGLALGVEQPLMIWCEPFIWISAAVTNHHTQATTLWRGIVFVMPIGASTFTFPAPRWSLDSISAFNVALSNNDLTATATSSGNYNFARTGSPALGKSYWEATVESKTAELTIGLYSAGIGGEEGQIHMGGSRLSIAVRANDGTIWSDNVQVGALGAGYDVGDTICVAADQAAELVWFRKNGDDWNGNASYDPASGVGGISLYNLLVRRDLRIYPALAPLTVNDQITINIGTGAFSYLMPSGYQNAMASLTSARWEHPESIGALTNIGFQNCTAIGFDIGFAMGPIGNALKFCRALQCNTGIRMRVVFGTVGVSILGNWMDRCEIGIDAPNSRSTTVTANVVTGDTGTCNSAPISSMVWSSGDHSVTVNTAAAHNIPIDTTKLILDVADTVQWGIPSNGITSISNITSTSFRYAGPASTPPAFASGTWNYPLNMAIRAHSITNCSFMANALTGMAYANGSVNLQPHLFGWSNLMMAMNVPCGWVGPYDSSASFKYISCWTDGHTPPNTLRFSWLPGGGLAREPGPMEGQEYNVMDCQTAAFGDIVIGGGTNHYKVRHNASNWIRVG